MTQQRRLRALQTAVKQVPTDFFAAHRGGYPDEIGTALVNAVFSIQARFNVRDPEKGVSGRLQRFRKELPEVRNDLEQLSTVPEETRRSIMGSSVTAGRSKASAVIEVSKAYTHQDIKTAEAFRQKSATDTKRIYTNVRGLGAVTFEYFAMLLGSPRVKADTMIIPFVNRALEKEKLSSASPMEAREPVISAYEANPTVAPSLTHFDHALWKAQSEGTF